MIYLLGVSNGCPRNYGIELAENFVWLAKQKDSFILSWWLKLGYFSWYVDAYTYWASLDLAFVSIFDFLRICEHIDILVLSFYTIVTQSIHVICSSKILDSTSTRFTTCRQHIKETFSIKF